MGDSHRQYPAVAHGLVGGDTRGRAPLPIRNTMRREAMAIRTDVMAPAQRHKGYGTQPRSDTP